MKNQIQNYISYITALLEAPGEQADWEKLLSEHLVKIGFYQHERLIHLLVTVLFALMEIISITALFITENLFFAALSAALLILLIPYVLHYYFLENSVQQLYLIYDEIRKRIS